MKLCQTHQNELQTNCESLGLGHLLSRSQEDSRARTGRWLDGEHTLETFDPLEVGAVSLLLDLCAMYPSVAVNCGDEGCPICVVNFEHTRGCDAPAGECRFTANVWLLEAANSAAEIWLQVKDRS